MADRSLRRHDRSRSGERRDLIPVKDLPMKRILISAAALASILAVGACNNKDNTGAANSDPGTSAAPVNAAQDAMSAPVGETSAVTMGRTTDGFVTGAATGDMYEIQAAKLAQTMSNSDAVKAFAATMIKDHTATSAKLKATLPTSGANVTPPTTLDERRQGMIDNLKAAGADFDKTYIAQQKAAHEEMLTLLKTYADNGDNAALKALAAETAPKVQMHLDMANKLDSAG
jgi:putative membrane protein